MKQEVSGPVNGDRKGTPEQSVGQQRPTFCACQGQNARANAEANMRFPSGEIHFSHTAISLVNKKVVGCFNSEDFAQLYFSMRGKSAFRVGDNSKPFASFDAQQHNLLFFSDEQAQQEIKPDPQVEMMTVYIPSDFLLHYLPETGSPFLEMREQILAGKPARLRKGNLPITPKITVVLHELLNCTYTGYCKRMFVQAKVIELLMLQFEQCEQNEAPVANGLKQTDIEKMLHARDLILQNMECPCSLIDLAHMVGTNEYYLKKHFKQVFGTTVFGYLNSYRMEQARKMLLEGDQKVGDIASALGFKYAAHFTAAFKKHFGYLPQKIKS
ncbi:helix-turn-helix transcriptional regulator [Pontibacter sp. HSC-36F09]|uniref:helix-turn-helix transcriptional regulator n=1 Tax=Pontibacter sp. HSC-36F09 TaxID=2910966 RepID=UPI00209E7A8F|nr:AraC family transcriptional regulator [Pontibacter sp. HSC-36F09]MCP2042883.1 AraC-like DNA-binding protein [Pontibacter sp. HSC-36F09]